MTTFYLKIVEKVSLLQNELKGNHRFAEGLGDWALGVHLCECDNVSICEYVCLWESMCGFVGF